MSAKEPEPIIKSQTVPATFVDGLSSITHVGAVTHLIFTVRQPAGHDPRSVDRVVQARLVVPTEQLQAMGRAMLVGKLDPTVDVPCRPGLH